METEILERITVSSLDLQNIVVIIQIYLDLSTISMVRL